MDKRSVQPRRVSALKTRIKKLAATNTVLRAQLSKLRHDANAGRFRGQRLNEDVGTSAMVSLFNPDGTLNMLSDSLVDYTGIAIDGTTKIRISDFIHPDDLPGSIEDQVKGNAQSDEPVRVHRIRRRDGIYRWFDGGFLPLKSSDGKVTQWCLSSTDIDARQHAEDLLSERERTSQDILDNIDTLVSLLAPNGDVETINKRTLEYTGQGREELQKWWLGPLVHADDLPLMTQIFRQGIASREGFECEFRMRRHDGIYRWFHALHYPLKDTVGQISRWCVSVNDIDDRKRVEESLRESERQARLIIDSIPGLICVFSATGELEFINQRVVEHYGRSFEEHKNWAGNDLAHPDDLDHAMKTFGASMASGEPFEIINRSRFKDGTYRWVQSLGLPLRDPSGRIVNWYNLMVDIHDRKLAEDALAVSERNLQLTIDTIPAMAWSATPDGSADFFNKHYQDFVGLSLDRLQGMSWIDTVFQDDVDGLLAAWHVMQVTGQGGQTEARIRRHDGEYRWFLQRTNPLRDEGGTIVRWYCVNTDIEEWKRAENELRRSEALLTQGEAVSETGSFFWWLETGEILWSKQLYRTFGYEPGSLVTIDRIAERVHSEDLHLLSEMSNRAQAGLNSEFELRVSIPDGPSRYLHLVAQPARDQHGRSAYLGAVQDVTQRAISKAAVDKLREELAHVARVTSLGALVASIAHEVNQPLSGIITNASTCVRMLDVNPPNVAGALETARRTIRDGNRASEVITRLRAMFRKGDSTTFEDLDLNEAVQEVIALARIQLQQGGTILRLYLAEDLPLVSADRVQIQQVILNLLLNAGEATISSKGEAHEIAVKTEENARGHIQLTVRDSGVGIDSAVTSKLFDAFFTTKSSGMGMGLSISRSIVERHNGRIWAKPNAERPGASFSFELPVKPTQAGGMTSSAPANFAGEEKT
ncbi:PAS domain-containing protein [Mesorhizobium opportunistum]|uniref:PAS domain-containing sensor histidine kinase n=1 Tax=Mesorhizobium opportunistum TaxID=593909 RepID=UPI0033363F11